MTQNSYKRSKLISKIIVDLSNVVIDYAKNPNKMLSEEVDNIFYDYERKSNKIDFEFLFNEINGYGKEFNDISKRLREKIYSMDELYKNIQTSKESRIIEELIKEQAKNYDKVQQSFVELSKLQEKFPDLLEENIMGTKKAKFNFIYAATDVYNHLYGYMVAEQFMAKNPGFMKKVSNLFRKPDNVIFKDFFNKDLLTLYNKRTLKVMIDRFGSKEDKELIEKLEL